MKTINVMLVKIGETIDKACQRACRMARRTKENVEFRFNDTPMYAHPKSCVEDLVYIYYLKNELITFRGY